MLIVFIVLINLFSYRKNGNAFFIDGPGGTGKTFLYNNLLAAVRKEGDIALAVASSGIAALLLPGGRTAHSRLKIPFKLESTCNIGFHVIVLIQNFII
jgi:hypothetical protein